MEVPSIFLNRILVEAAKKNAVSLHLAVGSLPTIRIDDQLLALEKESIFTTDLAEKIIIFIVNEEEAKKLKEEKEIVLVKELAGGFRFRINIFYQKNLPSISFYYISDTIKNPTDLNLPKILNDLIKLNSGLFIIAGPYGAGKTTTAVALVEEVNKSYKKNITTIEDPIEYLLVSKKSLVMQIQVGRDIKSVVKAIGHCLEEDSDLVYISEIKNEFEEAIPLVLELAAGNALVLLEINADSSVRVIEKVLNALSKKMSEEAARYNLADTLTGIIVQKLIPKIGGGMVLANEVMFASGPIKSLIREGKIFQLESVIQTSRKEGMISMNKSIEELEQNGKINRDNR